MNKTVHPLIPLEKRFWSKVNKTESCWLWTGAKNSNGYGHIWLNDRLQKAHRVSYELSICKVPEDMKVLHTCDNPGCVRPDHLYLGSMMDNTRDCMRKGRWLRWGPRLRFGPNHRSECV